MAAGGGGTPFGEAVIALEINLEQISRGDPGFCERARNENGSRKDNFAEGGTFREKEAGNRSDGRPQEVSENL